MNNSVLPKYRGTLVTTVVRSNSHRFEFRLCCQPIMGFLFEFDCNEFISEREVVFCLWKWRRRRNGRRCGRGVWWFSFVSRKRLSTWERWWHNKTSRISVWQLHAINCWYMCMAGIRALFENPIFGKYLHKALTACLPVTNTDNSIISDGSGPNVDGYVHVSNLAFIYHHSFLFFRLDSIGKLINIFITYCLELWI